jgi:hypothetical protein
LPELKDIYERSLGERVENYEAFIFTYITHTDITHTDIDLFPGDLGVEQTFIDYLRNTFAIPEQIELRKFMDHKFLGPRLHVKYRRDHGAGIGSLHETLLQVDSISNEKMSVIAPFDKDIRISRLGRFFLLSFLLGTLARYYPRAWLALLSRQNGDILLPVIRESIDIIQASFPGLVAQELKGFHRVPDGC